jgi:hypothetical protein
MSALPPKADMCGARANLRCEPITTAIKFVGNGPPGQHERLLTLERPSSAPAAEAKRCPREVASLRSESHETGRLPFANAASASTTQGARCSAST